MKQPKRVLDILFGSVLLALIAAVVWLSLDKTKNIRPFNKEAAALDQDLDFSFKDEAGKTRHLNDFKGRLVLVNLWAPWCLPCVEEMPSLLRLAKTFPEKLTILALTDEPLDSVQKFFKSLGSLPKNFILALSPDMKKVFAPSALPETYFFDKKGRFSLKVVGPRFWDSLRVKNQIMQMIEGEKLSEPL